MNRLVQWLLFRLLSVRGNLVGECYSQRSLELDFPDEEIDWGMLEWASSMLKAAHLKPPVMYLVAVP